jgi:hypothetical protein
VVERIAFHNKNMHLMQSTFIKKYFVLKLEINIVFLVTKLRAQIALFIEEILQRLTC